MTAEEFCRAASPRAPNNEALQQTRSALVGMDAALAAERRCSMDSNPIGEWQAPWS